MNIENIMNNNLYINIFTIIFLFILYYYCMDNRSQIEFFRKSVEKNIDDDKSHIKPTLQNIILNFGEVSSITLVKQGVEIANKVSLVNPKGTKVTQSNVWCPLIWKALLESGYSVPKEWTQVKLNNEEDYKIFNDAVKELATIPKWNKYAVNILVNDNKNYKNGTADFDNELVIKASDHYSKI